MVDYVKQDMSLIWAELGDYVAPLDAKITEGWLVEVPPRQYWNWIENRQDKMLAYMAQKGLPEWDETTEYLINRSFVQHNGITYRCIQTHTNQEPGLAPLYWVRAFSTWSQVGEAVGGLVPAADTTIYFTSPTTATTTAFTAFARTILDDTDAASVRTTIGAQQSDATLTALAGLTTGANLLPYFTGTDTVTTTTLTSFGRSLIDDVDNTAARTTLDVYSKAQVDAVDATKQPLDATLTALAGLTTSNNTMPYFTGVDTVTTTPITSFGRSLIDDVDATAARTTLNVYSTSEVDAVNATKQPLDATLTALAGVVNAADTLPYFTGVDVATTTSITSFARTILDDVDATTARTTLGLSNSATIVADTAATPSTIALRNASGNIVSDVFVGALSGNATTATTLQTSRTIALSGEVTGTATSFNGGANISIATTITDSGLLTPTLVNSFSMGTTGLRYRKIGNIVHVQGQVNRASLPIGVTITTLPAGYRPSRTVWASAEVFGAGNSQRATYGLDIDSAGVITAVYTIAEATAGTVPTGTLTFSINFMFAV